MYNDVHDVIYRRFMLAIMNLMMLVFVFQSLFTHGRLSFLNIEETKLKNECLLLMLTVQPHCSRYL